MNVTHSRAWLCVALLLPLLVEAAPSQIPEDRKYLDLDVVYLNKKMREVHAQGLVRSWSVSEDEATLTIEVGSVWQFLDKQKQMDLTRRLLSLFSYYIQNRDERGWQFGVFLKEGEATVAEDRGTWMRENKPPKLNP